MPLTVERVSADRITSLLEAPEPWCLSTYILLERGKQAGCARGYLPRTDLLELFAEVSDTCGKEGIQKMHD